MADEHRRVEPRGVVGSGMLTDPERIEQLEQERDRVERTWREGPKRKFGEVLTETPPRAPGDAEEPPPDPRRRGRGQGAGDGAASDDQAAEPESAAPSPVEGVDEERPLPRVPPDPRMARLHAMVATSQAPKAATPPASRRKRP